MILLPTHPSPVDVEPRYVDFGGILRPGSGAKILRLNRQGNRYGALVTMPPLDSDELGRVFVARLIRAKRQGLRMPFPLLGVDQGEPGNLVVNGAGQAGLSINLRGGTAGYQAKEGYWVSFENADGQHYLHNVSAGATVAVGGAVTLAIEPMLRVRFPDGAQVHLDVPMIEGVVVGDEQRWRMQVDHNIGLTFEIEEAE